MRVYANTYYKNRYETDPNFRAKMNELKHELNKQKHIEKLGQELVLATHPGRPRKYATNSPLENYIISTPSTQPPEHSEDET